MKRQNQLTSVAVVTIFALLAVASGGKAKDDPAPVSTTTTTSAERKLLGSCDKSTKGACNEYYGGSKETEKKDCDALKGTWLDGQSCAKRESLIGVCAMREISFGDTKPQPIREKAFTYDEGANKGVGTEAKALCDTLTGTFEPGPAMNKPAPAPKPAAAKKKK